MKNTLSKEQFGPWALVTGASSGIGKEFALQLARQGFNLVLAARREALLQELGAQLKRDYGTDTRIVVQDLSAENAAENLIKAVDDLEIGLLISNAGFGRPGRFLSFEFEELMYIVRLNALSHLQLTHHFGRKMAERKRGGILLTGAMGAIDGLPFMANESGTKSLVQGLGQALNSELRDSGVHVTVLVTSPTETPVLADLGFTKSNMPSKPIAVELCVKEALQAMKKNKGTIIPGAKYRIMKALVPASVSRSMMSKMLKKNNGIV